MLRFQAQDSLADAVKTFGKTPVVDDFKAPLAPPLPQRCVLQQWAKFGAEIIYMTNTENVPVFAWENKIGTRAHLVTDDDWLASVHDFIDHKAPWFMP